MPPGTARAENGEALPPPPDKARRIQRAITLENYARADSLLLRLREGQRRPAPWADLLEASLLLARQVDFGDTLGTGRYHLLRDRALDHFRASLRELPDSARGLRASHHFALGSLHAMEAQRHNDVRRAPLAAAGPASNAAEHYRSCLALDSTRTAARIGLAIHRFWKSHVLRALAWTPFVADRRQEAVAELSRIVGEGGPHSAAAGFSLVWVQIERDRARRAAALADSLLHHYSDVRTLLEGGGKAHLLAGNLDRAAELYTRLEASLRKGERRNETRLVGVLHRLANIDAERERWAEVIGHAHRAARVTLSPEQRKRKRDDLKRLEQLRARAQEQLSRP